jgi:NAD(P) transhydrogenase subunit alpha
LVGAIIVTAHAKTTLELVFGLLAIVLATVNLVGGFAVTERMLQMFKARPKQNKSAEPPQQAKP